MSSRVTSGYPEVKKLAKSSLKGSSSKKEKTHRRVESAPIRSFDDYVFTITDIWNAPKVPRSILRELIRVVSMEILNRGMSFILLGLTLICLYCLIILIVLTFFFIKA